MVSKFFLEEVSKINYRIKYWLHGALLPLLEIKKGIWNGFIQMPFVPMILQAGMAPCCTEKEAELL